MCRKTFSIKSKGKNFSPSHRINSVRTTFAFHPIVPTFQRRLKESELAEVRASKKLLERKKSKRTKEKLERAFHNNKPRKENSELDKVFKRFRTVWGAFTNELPKSFQKRGMKKFSICANFLLLNFLARRMFSCRRPAIISSTRLQAVYFYFHSIHFCLPSQPRREKSFT